MKFFIDFLGCKVNSYEASSVSQNLKNHGYIEVNSDSSDVDLIIINTCAVTETSSSKSKKMIRRYRREFPKAIIVVMGCYSQYDSEFISESLNAQIVIGTSFRDKIYELISEYLKTNQKIIKVEESKNIKRYENLSLKSYFDRTRAYVKIQDGCNNFCSYCLIPYVRGRSRSRNSIDVIEEIQTLVVNGYKEIILTGIDQGSYGLDLEEDINFSKLLEKIVTNVKGLYRLRISSIEESQIDDLFLKILKENKVIANHLHIPLQSGSEKIVTLMHRKYNLARFESLINSIREIRPDIALSTDVIVGFPSETDEDFLETYNFIKKIKFSKVHVFPYSDRKGTVASKITDKVSDIAKKERVKKLISLSNELAKDYNSKFYNKEIEFLFESATENNYFIGHSSNFLCAKVYSEEDLKGKIKTINFNESIEIIE